MHSSRIVTIAPDALNEEPGYVLLGIIDGVAYVHLCPWEEPRTIVFPNGDLTNPQPEGEGMQGVVESPLPSWVAASESFYDPMPEPFRWDAFAAMHPDVASVLMPHCWAGE